MGSTSRSGSHIELSRADGSSLDHVVTLAALRDEPLDPRGSVVRGGLSYGVQRFGNWPERPSARRPSPGVGSDRIQAMMPGDPAILVESAKKGRGRACGPHTMATATAWLSVTIGFGEMPFEQLVQREDLWPVGVLGAGWLVIDSGNRGLRAGRGRAAFGTSICDQGDPLGDVPGVPKLSILLFQGPRSGPPGRVRRISAARSRLSASSTQKPASCSFASAERSVGDCWRPFRTRTVLPVEASASANPSPMSSPDSLNSFRYASASLISSSRSPGESASNAPGCCRPARHTSSLAPFVLMRVCHEVVGAADAIST